MYSLYKNSPGLNLIQEAWQKHHFSLMTNHYGYLWRMGRCLQTCPDHLAQSLRRALELAAEVVRAHVCAALVEVVEVQRPSYSVKVSWVHLCRQQEWINQCRMDHLAENIVREEHATNTLTQAPHILSLYSTAHKQQTLQSVSSSWSSSQENREKHF